VFSGHALLNTVIEFGTEYRRLQDCRHFLPRSENSENEASWVPWGCSGPPCHCHARITVHNML